MSASGEIRRARDGGRNDWRTPRELFDRLDAAYSFTLDAAADDQNTLCALGWYTEADDAFAQDPHGETIWCNPPYGALDRWIDLFIHWSADNYVIALVPAATDTRWWLKAFYSCFRVELLAGRVKFINPATGKADGSNTTGSALLHFCDEWMGKTVAPPVELIDWRTHDWSLR